MTDVILVNALNENIGKKEKMQTHKDGNLHRAFSVLLFNSKDELLIHKRASSKYHCGGLWTNTCCSHPLPGENTIKAALRRLKEELGYINIDLYEQFTFTYKAEFENGLIENEIDTVYVGHTDNDPPSIDNKEIEVWKWIPRNELVQDIEKHPKKYTVWFKEILRRDIMNLK